MFVRVVRRAEIGDLLSGQGHVVSRPAHELSHPRDLPGLDPTSVAVIWSQDPNSHSVVPELLVTADGQERDWLAWLINFAPTLRPFTAFCRVLSSSSFMDFFDARQPPSLGRVENAGLGLVLGEVLSSEHVAGRPREPLSVSTCASMLSFVLVRELAVHRRGLVTQDLARRWSTVRQLTRQRARGLEFREVSRVAGVVGALRGRPASMADEATVHACQEVLTRGDVGVGAFAFGVTFEVAARDMLGTREERVDVFERFLNAPVSASASRDRSFELGYLASRINPGTLSHASLLAPTLHRNPASMLWYGVCAGLSAEAQLVGEFGGVGRRILRDLLEPDELVARPRMDVAASELEVILASDRTDEFPVTSPSLLSVELAPSISTVVNWSSRARSRRMVGGGERPDERTRFEQDLGAAVQLLADLHRRVRGTDPQEEGPVSGDLFDQGPERRGSRKR